VTFVFTDIEASTRQWEMDAVAMDAAVATHDRVLRDAVEAHGGRVVKSTGDGMLAVFDRAAEAVGAAIDGQLALAAHELPAARMGVHTGEAFERGGDYFGPALNRAARLTAIGHGGQVLVSQSTALVVSDFELRDLGEHRLRDLADAVRVFQAVHPELRAEFPRLRSLNLVPGNLPRQVTTFVGRSDEVSRLGVLVCERPLVTLTGVGGVGKTRLALQVAAEVVEEFADGAWLCELAPVADPDAVWETLAASLGVYVSLGRPVDATVLDYLAPKRLLLVLDNCEHLLDEVARVVDAIGQRCARVAVLATSREGLGLTGERMVAVRSLPVPVDDADLHTLMRADAVQLFSDRANAARNDFELTDRNAAAVGVLCRRLDGIPLAIELAAARVRSLSPEDLVVHLDQRFKLLTRGSRAALERHQTLRSTIDWSYDLLEPPERRALDRLSVFAGGCDLAAAEAVLASDGLDALDVVDVLGQLVDKSLVIADTEDPEGGIRYRLLETIRQYAQERLQDGGDTAAVRHRHADYYVGVAEITGPRLRRRGQLEWANAVTRETDNFRAVLDWAVETPAADHAFRLIAPFTVTGMRIGDAAMDWADTACTIPGGPDHPLFALVAAFASLGATFKGDFERAEGHAAAATQAEEMTGIPQPPVARAQAVLALFSGDGEQAVQHAETWVELARTSDDSFELAHALVMLAGALGPVGAADVPAAIATMDEALQVARHAGIMNALSIGLPYLAGLLPIEESGRALTLLDEAIEVGTQVGDRMGVEMATFTRGAIAAQRHEWRTALQAALDTADQKLQLGDLATMPMAFDLAVIAFCGLEHFEIAGVLSGKAATTAQRGESHWWADTLAAVDATLLEALGEQQLAALAARGAAFEIPDAVTYLRAQAEPVLHAESSA
jgi:predicted ATPase